MTARESYSMCSLHRIALLSLSLLSVILSSAHASFQCRVFVDATTSGNHFMLLQTSSKDPSTVSTTPFTTIQPSLSSITSTELYAFLKPGFVRIADHITSTLNENVQTADMWEPRHCQAHVFVSGFLLSEVKESHLDVMYAQFYDDAIADAQFPFQIARDNLQTIPSDLLSYFRILGTNFLSGILGSELTPANQKMQAILSIDTQDAHINVDFQERWKKSLRSKSKHKPLARSDFIFRTFHNFGVEGILNSILKRADPDAENKQTDNAGADTHVVIDHPCFPKGYREIGTNHGMEVHGAGNADDCRAIVKQYIAESNQECPSDSFCALKSVSQPVISGPLVVFGVSRRVLQYANQVLRQQKQEELSLPSPNVDAVKSAANTLCQMHLDDMQDIPYKRSVEDTTAFACLDLCYTFEVLLQLDAFTVEEQDTNGKQLIVLDKWENETLTERVDEVEIQAWLTGAFLYLNVQQNHQASKLASEMLAAQVGEGLPLGIQLSVVVLGCAVLLLLMTINTASRQSREGHRGRRWREQTAATSALRFIDDASE